MLAQERKRDGCAMSNAQQRCEELSQERACAMPNTQENWWRVEELLEMSPVKVSRIVDVNYNLYTYRGGCDRRKSTAKAKKQNP
jgi:hypothetical protein